LPPHPHLGGLPFLERIFGSAMKFLFPACVHCDGAKTSKKKSTKKKRIASDIRILLLENRTVLPCEG